MDLVQSCKKDFVLLDCDRISSVRIIYHLYIKMNGTIICTVHSNSEAEDVNPEFIKDKYELIMFLEDL